MKRGCRVAWCIPPLSAGSGGLNTIFRNAEALCEAGCECDFYIPASIATATPRGEIQRQIVDWYGFSHAFQIFPCATCLEGVYDLAIATLWSTADFVEASGAKKKAYFVQDWEPSFYPVGEEHLNAFSSYRLKLGKITIGKWLALKCSEIEGASAAHTIFGADKNLYRPLDGCAKERAICAIYQPEKPRRASQLLVDALTIFKKFHPDVVVYLYGSNAPSPSPEFIQLGLLSREKCNELYNACLCGVSMSTTNPSRIPFEMMASGLPVVDLFGENTIYDFPIESCLAMPDAASLATAIGRFVNDGRLVRSVAEAGLAFMRDKDLKREQLEFVEACYGLLGGGFADDVDISPNPIEPVRADQEEFELLRQLKQNDLRLAADRFTPAALRDETIRMKLTMGSSSYREIKVAVWSSPNQRDLIWLPFKRGAISDREYWQSESVRLSVGEDPRMYHFYVYALQDNSSSDVFVAAGGKVLALSHGRSELYEEGVIVSADNGISIELQGCPPDGADSTCNAVEAEGCSSDGSSSLLQRIAKLVRRDM